MALVDSTLQSAIKTIFDTVKTYNGKTGQAQEDAINYIAQQLAAAIDAQIKTAVVTVPAGVAVQVNTGTGTGATTAPGIGSLS